MNKGLWIKVIKEPLLHFLLIGALIFGFYAYLHKGESTHQITLSPDLIHRLETAWEIQWRRPPTEEELANLVKNNLKEEILYREALELGLDQEDTIIRRWLTQKMDFLSQDMMPINEPTEEELKAYFEAHQTEFNQPPRLSFQHIFFNPDQRGENTQKDAEQLLTQLPRKSSLEDNLASLGDRFMLSHSYTLLTPSAVSQIFGNSFTKQVFQLESGQWQKPIKSGYGWHLVKVNQKIPAQIGTFEEHKAEIFNKLLEERKEKANEQFYKSLSDRYTIQIDKAVLNDYPYLEEVSKEDA